MATVYLSNVKRAQIEDDLSIGESGIFILPAWLAIDKEFI